MKLHSRSKFYNSHTFYKWLILEFREITISNPGEKCKICLGLGSPHVDGTGDISRKWWRARSAKDAEMISDLGAPSFGIEVTFLVVNHSGRQVLCFLAAPVVLCLHCRFIHSLLWIQSIPEYRPNPRLLVSHNFTAASSPSVSSSSLYLLCADGKNALLKENIPQRRGDVVFIWPKSIIQPEGPARWER